MLCGWRAEAVVHSDSAYLSRVETRDQGDSSEEPVAAASRDLPALPQEVLPPVQSH